MDQAVAKFINYLEGIEEFMESIIKNCPLGSQTVLINGTHLEVRKIQGEKNNLEKIILFSKPKLSKSSNDNSIYKYFSDVSYYLKNSPLKMREKMATIFYIVKKNQVQITKYPERISGILDLNVLHELYAPTMELEKFNEFIQKQNINELINKKIEELTFKELILRQKILEAEKITENEHKIFIKVHQYLEDHYLKKIESYTKKDIKFIEVALKKLGVSEELISAFISILYADLEKRKQVQEENNTDLNVTSKEKTIALSPKEYNTIFRKIESMYDIQEHKIVKALTKDEIIYLVSLMLKINIPVVEIKKCIQNINWHGCSAYNNPITAFNDYYEKLEKNNNITEVELALKHIKEYIEALFIPESVEEYLFWKQEIAEELKKVRNSLNQDDEYELREAKKLFIKKENKDKK